MPTKNLSPILGRPGLCLSLAALLGALLLTMLALSSFDPAQAAGRQCNDGIDNDYDGLIDHPADPGCRNPGDNDETDRLAVSPPPAPPPPPQQPPPPAALPAPEAGPALPGDPTGTQTPDPPKEDPGPVGAGSTADTFPQITPFPVIRLRVSPEGGGVFITLLRVQSSRGSSLTIYCAGPACPRRGPVVYKVVGVARGHAFERHLRAGTRLTIYVTKPGMTGKYMQFLVRKNRPPARRDRCARLAGAPPIACPES